MVWELPATLEPILRQNLKDMANPRILSISLGFADTQNVDQYS